MLNLARKQRLANVLASSSLVVAAFAVSPARAQDAVPQAGNADEGLGVIVVQARKVSEDVQNVPISVSVLSGQDLEKRSIVRFQDIAAFTPGLYMRSGASTPSAIAVSLRGQYQNDNLATLDPSVGTYVDGVYWARAYGLNSSFLDISSVQVLKGPQGTLFGRNTTGGAMLINTNDPKLGQFSGKASVSYGKYNEFEPTLVVNVPVGESVAIRLAGKRLSRDGYTTNSVPPTAASVILPGNPAVAQQPAIGSLNGLKIDDRNRWQGRAKVLVQATDNFSLLFSGEYFWMHEIAPSRNSVFYSSRYVAANPTFTTGGTAATFAGQTVLNGEIARLAADKSITSNNELPYVYAKTQTYNLTAALDTEWGQIKAIGGIRKVDAYASIDLDGTYLPIHFTEGRQSIKQESGELQITGKAFDRAVDFALGAFVFHESGYDQSISITVPTLNPQTSHFWGNIDSNSIGAYGQATWHWTDQLSLTGGLRYSIDDKGLESRNNAYDRTTGKTICSFTGVTVVEPELVGAPQCSARRRDSFSGWSYTAGIEFKPAEDVLLYAKTAKGFRSGGQNLRASNATQFVPFLPEIVYSYEIGFKGEFLDRRLRVNLAAYTSLSKNLQRSTIVPIAGSTNTATLLGNAGKARIRGLEAEVTALLFDGFTLSLAGALTDPKYTDYKDAGGDRSFERFNGIPKRQFTIAADYTHALGTGTSLSLHADYAWRGKVPLDQYFYAPNPENAAIVQATTGPALGLVNARASIAFRNFEIGVYGRNLTNERKMVQNQFVAPVGYISTTYSEPRTYGVTASVSF